jgi:hypothetical protein
MLTVAMVAASLAAAMDVAITLLAATDRCGIRRVAAIEEWSATSAACTTFLHMAVAIIAMDITDTVAVITDRIGDLKDPLRLLPNATHNFGVANAIDAKSLGAPNSNTELW